MRRWVITSCVVVAGLLSACGSESPDLAGQDTIAITVSPSTEPASSTTTSGATTSTTATSTTTTSTTTPERYALPICNDATPTAPEAWYRDTPKYVGNEMPIAKAQGWAKDNHPGYETVWIDREHNGWVALGFSSGDVAAIQEEIEAEFPDDGIVAVELPYTRAEIDEMFQRLKRRLADEENMYPTSPDLERSRVSVWVGPLTEERIAIVADAAAGDPVCIEGIPVDELPEPGPQPTGGEGWRLLGEHDGGSFAARIATNVDQYRDLWRDSVLTGEPPEVDFETEVVFWLPHVYGSSCPEIRLDDVVVNSERGLLYPEVVSLSQDQGCTADANPYQYVVAVERSILPAGPFMAGSEVDQQQMHPDAIHIDVDLTVPGSTTRGRPVPRTPLPPEATPTPMIVEPGFPFPVTLDISCGIRVIGEINGYLWATEVDEIPEKWKIVGDELVEVEVLLKLGDQASLTVTANGASVKYHIADEPEQGCG